VGNVEELFFHLFLHFEVARSVWLKLMMWTECSYIIPPILFVYWGRWTGVERNKRIGIYGSFGTQLFGYYGKLGIIGFQ